MEIGAFSEREEDSSRSVGRTRSSTITSSAEHGNNTPRTRLVNEESKSDGGRRTRSYQLPASARTTAPAKAEEPQSAVGIRHLVKAKTRPLSCQLPAKTTATAEKRHSVIGTGVGESNSFVGRF